MVLKAATETPAAAAAAAGLAAELFSRQKCQQGQRQTPAKCSMTLRRSWAAVCVVTGYQASYASAVQIFARRDEAAARMSFTNPGMQVAWRKTAPAR
jgi:hypothetical protein